MSALASIVGVAGYLVTIYFIFAPSFAKAFDNWMISLLLWMSPWAGVVLADFFIKRKGQIDVAELYRDPDMSAYGDINWSGIIAFLAGSLPAGPSKTASSPRCRGRSRPVFLAAPTLAGLLVSSSLGAFTSRSAGGAWCRPTPELRRT